MLYKTLIKEIWPNPNMSDLVLNSFENDLATCKLDYGQIKEALLYCTKHAISKKTPDTAQILKHIQKLRHAQFVARAAEKNPDGLDFIEQQRRIQAKDFPPARTQPRWLILSVWFDQEFTSRAIGTPQRLAAAQWVASALEEEKATYNEAVYAAAAIYEVPAEQLDQRIQESRMKSGNDRIVNGKRIKVLVAKEEAERNKRLARVAV